MEKLTRIRVTVLLSTIATFLLMSSRLLAAVRVGNGEKIIVSSIVMVLCVIAMITFFVSFKR